MKFSPQQIELACRLKELGLPWEPHVGHYFYDPLGIAGIRSPFQDRVFLLDSERFMQRVGGLARFTEVMTWLPTWSDARQILSSLEVSPLEVQRAVLGANALRRGTELDVLYELVADNLARPTAANIAAAATNVIAVG